MLWTGRYTDTHTHTHPHTQITYNTHRADAGSSTDLSNVGKLISLHGATTQKAASHLRIHGREKLKPYYTNFIINII
jgi:hypothetical protein